MKKILEGDEMYPVFHLEDYEPPTDWMKDTGHTRKIVEIDDELQNRHDRVMEEFNQLQKILSNLDQKTEWSEA